MKNEISIEVKGEEIVLHPFRSIYWPAEKTLMIADLHLGKEHHFRKEGIPIPMGANSSTLSRLNHLVKLYDPGTVMILGDLFHSEYNSGWEQFRNLIYAHASVDFVLVSGNHDILHPEIYDQSKIQVIEPGFELGPFELTHKPLSEKNGKYNLAGHIHPGIRMRGLGRQSLRLPCFWFGKERGLLPAFGSFTGLGIIQPRKGEQVFAVLKNDVIEVGR